MRRRRRSAVTAWVAVVAALTGHCGARLNRSQAFDRGNTHAASASTEVVVPSKICIMRAGTVRDAAGLILRSCCRAFGGFGFLLLE
jgi:hypothetical protein